MAAAGLDVYIDYPTIDDRTLNKDATVAEALCLLQYHMCNFGFFTHSPIIQSQASARCCGYARRIG